MMDMPFLTAIEGSRRREILTAVARVLIDGKRQAVEMQEVLEQSGMLYEDVAAEFSDLDDVLLSLVRCVSGWIGNALGSEAGRPTSFDDMLEGLSEFARRYAYANATILPGIFRVFLTEGSRRSQLQRDFYDQGPVSIARALVRFLETAKTAGIAEIPAPDLVAGALMGMLREPLYYELAIHSKRLSPTLTSVDRAPDLVLMFVKGCAGRQGR